MTCFPL